jgi:hypothetical protein
MTTTKSPQRGSPAASKPDSPEEILDLPEEFRIPRSDDRDLAFAGWRIGYAESEPIELLPGYETGASVSIYLTVGKHLITHCIRWEERDGKPRTEKHAVGHHGTLASYNCACDALEWLKEDAGGRLGSVSKRAWTIACQTWPELADEEVERIK